MIPAGPARADMHCHSTASALARLEVQRSAGLPECATPPDEVYELAKRRGMDFVTITDHDTIDGALAIAHLPDVFVSEELTAWFPGEEQAVHILCFGITGEDHEFLQSHARDLEACAAYLDERGIACALAHPFFAVAAPLSARHRRRLAELFGIWEVRNGSRARELNAPAAVYIETHGGIGIGGSDDHAGVDIGRTWTETPPASTPEEFLRHLREGRAEGRGDQGSAAKWAHSALVLAIRALMAEPDVGLPSPPDPATILRIAERVASDGRARGGDAEPGLGPAEARALLRAWADALGAGSDPAALIAEMQEDGFSHAELARRARRVHEKRMRAAVSAVAAAVHRGDGYAEAAHGLVDACIPVVPYVPATALLGREVAKLSRRDMDGRRVALVVDGAGSVHGVTHTVERVREHGVPGWEVEVIGTDPRVDRRLAAVTEDQFSLYPGMTIGVPGALELVETLTEGDYDLIHVCSPGPSGIGSLLAARIAGLPVLGSYHTELATYARLRAGDPAIEAFARAALGSFYGQCDVVLSPSPSADGSLASLGIDPDRIARWAPGVDVELYASAAPDPEAFPGEVKVLYAGRLTKEKGVGLLAESFLRARERDPRLHLLLAGGGPEEQVLRDRLGRHATFLGWLDREALAVAYASSDLFLFASRTDTYGQVIAEAQASGLAVVAVAEGGPVSLIRDRRTGWLCAADPDEIAAAVAQLAASPFLREQLGRNARAALAGRTWEAAMAELAAGYERAVGRGRRKPGSAPLEAVA